MSLRKKKKKWNGLDSTYRRSPFSPSSSSSSDDNDDDKKKIKDAGGCGPRHDGQRDRQNASAAGRMDGSLCCFDCRSLRLHFALRCICLCLRLFDAGSLNAPGLLFVDMSVYLHNKVGVYWSWS
jgi:hypothetical protein